MFFENWDFALVFFFNAHILLFFSWALSLWVAHAFFRTTFFFYKLKKIFSEIANVKKSKKEVNVNVNVKIVK